MPTGGSWPYSRVSARRNCDDAIDRLGRRRRAQPKPDFPRPLRIRPRTTSHIAEEQQQGTATRDVCRISPAWSPPRSGLARLVRRFRAGMYTGSRKPAVDCARGDNKTCKRSGPARDPRCCAEVGWRGAGRGGGDSRWRSGAGGRAAFADRRAGRGESAARGSGGRARAAAEPQLAQLVAAAVAGSAVRAAAATSARLRSGAGRPTGARGQAPAAGPAGTGRRDRGALARALPRLRARVR